MGVETQEKKSSINYFHFFYDEKSIEEKKIMCFQQKYCSLEIKNTSGDSYKVGIKIIDEVVSVTIHAKNSSSYSTQLDKTFDIPINLLKCNEEKLDKTMLLKKAAGYIRNLLSNNNTPAESIKPVL